MNDTALNFLCVKILKKKKKKKRSTYRPFRFSGQKGKQTIFFFRPYIWHDQEKWCQMSLMLMLVYQQNQVTNSYALLCSGNLKYCLYFCNQMSDCDSFRPKSSIWNWHNTHWKIKIKYCWHVTHFPWPCHIYAFNTFHSCNIAGFWKGGNFNVLNIKVECWIRWHVERQKCFVFTKCF